MRTAGQASPTKLILFDTHPIQYRSPIFREIERRRPGQSLVVFASDFSMRGYTDKEFSKSFSWDTPLLDGFRHRVLNSDRGDAIDGWRRFSRDSVADVFDEFKPSAILLNTIAHEYSFAAYYEALRRRLPIWLRVETQDDAFVRKPSLGFARSLYYRFQYLPISRFFYIGKLNRQHYLHHGVRDEKLRPGYYCTEDRCRQMSLSEKWSRRHQKRIQLGLGVDDKLVAFSGKFIEKKNPVLILDALMRLEQRVLSRTSLMLVGSGELEGKLKEHAQALLNSKGVKTIFTGFVNQQEITDYYLAADVTIMPSRRMGETWGLVANEAMQAGNAVIVSDAVGCSEDFCGLPRFFVFRDGDADGLARVLASALAFEVDFDWASETMRRYSPESVAQSICDEMDELP